jgi:hypothetical protein
MIQKRRGATQRCINKNELQIILHIVETETNEGLDEFIVLPVTLLEFLHFNIGRKETHFLIRSPSVMM